MAHRQACETYAGLLARGGNGERGAARVLPVECHGDLVGQRGDLSEEVAGIGGFGIIAKACNQRYGVAQHGQVLGELGGERGV